MEFHAPYICPSSFTPHNLMDSPNRHLLSVRISFACHYFPLSPSILSCPPSILNPFVPVSSFSDTSFKIIMCSCLSRTLPVTFQSCLPVEIVLILISLSSLSAAVHRCPEAHFLSRRVTGSGLYVRCQLGRCAQQTASSRLYSQCEYPK